MEVLLTTEDFKNGGWNAPEGAKVFVSLPMKDKEQEDVLKKMQMIFDGFCKFTGRDDLELINQYFKAVPNEITEMDRAPVWCLADSLKIMAHAGIVIFSDDYWRARGCLAEHYICKEYGIPFTFQSLVTVLGGVTASTNINHDVKTEYSPILHTNVVVE